MASILRTGLLDGVQVRVVAIPDRHAAGAGLAQELEALGARIAGPSGAEEPGEQRKPNALVLDAGDWRSGTEDAAPLQDLLGVVWSEVHAVATGSLIPGGGGRIVLISPPGRAVLAPAAAAALENLARTLSVEWARYGITSVALAPGAATSLTDLATVVGYILSPAGGYLSGTRLELNSLRPSA